MTSDRQNKKRKAKKRADNQKLNDHQAEFSAEITNAGMREEAPLREEMNNAAESENNATSYSLGWLALALSIASLFVLPQWLGLAGIVLGGAAWFTGMRGLGLWSIAIGTISLVLYIVLVPYYA